MSIDQQARQAHNSNEQRNNEAPNVKQGCYCSGKRVHCERESCWKNRDQALKDTPQDAR